MSQPVTISNPLAPPPQQFTNVATLINGQATTVGLMLFFRPFNPSGGPATPGEGLPGSIIPGFGVRPAPGILLIDGTDYTRNGGILTMTAPPGPGDTLVAVVFARGKQLGGATPERYIAPWILTVSGPYDAVGLNYRIVFGATISGVLDGVSSLFTWGAVLDRIQLFKNGILQTIGLDYSAGRTALVFLPGAIPQPGDVLTILGFNG